MGFISEEDLCLSLLRLGQERGIRCHEGFPLDLICLQEMFLGPFQDKPQAVEVVQTTAAAQQEPEAFLDKSPRNFPIPIRQVDACLFGQRLDHSPQLGLLVPVEGGGGTTRLLKAKGCGLSPRGRGNLLTVESKV